MNLTSASIPPTRHAWDASFEAFIFCPLPFPYPLSLALLDFPKIFIGPMLDLNLENYVPFGPETIIKDNLAAAAGAAVFFEPQRSINITCRV